jgi:hypothetical protein
MELAYSRQKSYLNIYKQKLEFEAREMVFLKISSMKGVVKLKKKGTLRPYYMKSLKIIKRLGK